MVQSRRALTLERPDFHDAVRYRAGCLGDLRDGLLYAVRFN